MGSILPLEVILWIILSQLQKILDKDRLKSEHPCCFSVNFRAVRGMLDWGM